MFKRAQGKTKFMWLPVTPSTDFNAGDLVAFSGGKLIPATSATVAADIIGVIRHDISSSDADYAEDRLVEVEVPVEKNVVWEADVNAGLVSGDIGGYFDLQDAGTVDRSASLNDIVRCVGVISSTKGKFILNI